MRHDTPYRRFVADLLEGSEWRPADHPDLDDLARAAGTSGWNPELELHLPGSRATLDVTLAGWSDDLVAELVLVCTLDPRFQHRERHFMGSLSAAHDAIAAKYATTYLDPQSDPSIVLTGEIPTDYGVAELECTLSAVTATAFEVERLHDRICAPMRPYVATPCVDGGVPRRTMG